MKQTNQTPEQFFAASEVRSMQRMIDSSQKILDKQEVKVYVLDFGDTPLISPDIQGILQWIEADMQNLSGGEELEYTITTRIMTKKELDDLPEWS